MRFISRHLFGSLSQACILIVGMVDNRTTSGEKQVGHGGHRAGKDGVRRQRLVDPLDQLLQLHVLVLAHDGALLLDVGHALHGHGRHQADQQAEVGVPRYGRQELLEEGRERQWKC